MNGALGLGTALGARTRVTKVQGSVVSHTGSSWSGSNGCLSGRLPCKGKAMNPVTLKRDVATSCSVSPDMVFDVATLAVMPLYALMIWFPSWKGTQRIMRSDIFFLAFSALYAYLLYVLGGWAIFTPLFGSMQHGGFSHANGWCLPALADMMKNSSITAITWVHLLLMDLFQARWVYFDSLAHQVSSAHSLAMCFMVGPLGLLSHCITKTVTIRNRTWQGSGI
jgi:hypothetical protein